MCCSKLADEEPDLKGFLAKQKGATGLALQRVLFGSSGFEQRPGPGGPLRHYTKCKDLLSFPSKCMASSFHLCTTPFTNPADLDSCAYKCVSVSQACMHFCSNFVKFHVQEPVRALNSLEGNMPM